MSWSFSRNRTPNCDGNPARSRAPIFSRKPAVCSREKTPSEKSMKPALAINCAIRSRSVSAKGRRSRRVDRNVTMAGPETIQLQRDTVYKPRLLDGNICARHARSQRTKDVSTKFVAKDERDWQPAPA